MNKPNIIADLSFQVATETIQLCRKLVSHKEYVLSKQLLRSGTSIGANVQEAIAGQSGKDFIAKMSIASKEARETKYWLCLLRETDELDIDYSKYLQKINDIINILTKIVKTSQLIINS